MQILKKPANLFQKTKQIPCHFSRLAETFLTEISHFNQIATTINILKVLQK